MERGITAAALTVAAVAALDAAPSERIAALPGAVGVGAASHTAAPILCAPPAEGRAEALPIFVAFVANAAVVVAAVRGRRTRHLFPTDLQTAVGKAVADEAAVTVRVEDARHAAMTLRIAARRGRRRTIRVVRALDALLVHAAERARTGGHVAAAAPAPLAPSPAAARLTAAGGAAAVSTATAASTATTVSPPAGLPSRGGRYVELEAAVTRGESEEHGNQAPNGHPFTSPLGRVALLARRTRVDSEPGSARLRRCGSRPRARRGSANAPPWRFPPMGCSGNGG